jgi:hypothetical protein
LNGADYDAAISNIEALIKKNLPADTVEYYDAFLAKYSSFVPEDILSFGQPWGALEEMKNHKYLAPGLKFDLPTKKDAQKHSEAAPWEELLVSGSFSENTLAKLPVSYQVKPFFRQTSTADVLTLLTCLFVVQTTDSWRDLILESSVKQMTWLHALHLGVCSAERGGLVEPRNYFNM